MSLRADVDDRRQLMAVRQQVAVAQHDALRRALRARREEHDRRLVGARRVGDAASRAIDRSSARSLANVPDLAAHVLEVEDRRLRLERGDQRLELRLLDEPARRDDQR